MGNSSKTIFRSPLRLSLGLWVAVLGASAPAHSEDIIHTKTVLSDVYTIDRIYKSMTGPSSTQQIYLSENHKEPELLWIVGYKAVMRGADGLEEMPQDFMCHSNLDYESWRHRYYYSKGNYGQGRLFTLSQGQLEVRLPEGFGIPVFSNEPFSLTTQVLNHNVQNNSFDLRHQIAISYIYDKDITEPLKPLYPSGVYGLVLLKGEDGYMLIKEPDAQKHGPGCLPGQTASENFYFDPFGRQFSGHWVVKPGREENHTNVTRVMNLPYDTTLHYIAVHLHPFAESIELRDLTENKSLFKSRVRPFEGKIGIEHVEYFSNEEGITVFKDHEYEVVSVYNNTSGVDQDSMAVMYLYLYDKDFRRP